MICPISLKKYKFLGMPFKFRKIRLRSVPSGLPHENQILPPKNKHGDSAVFNLETDQWQTEFLQYFTCRKEEIWGMGRIGTKYFAENFQISLDGRELCMDEWTIKTPNPICRLFFKIYLLTEFAALVFNRFYRQEIHSLIGWYFRPSLWTVAPIGRRICTSVLLPLYLLSDLPPPFPN